MYYVEKLFAVYFVFSDISDGVHEKMKTLLSLANVWTQDVGLLNDFSVSTSMKILVAKISRYFWRNKTCDTQNFDKCTTHFSENEDITSWGCFPFHKTHILKIVKTSNESIKNDLLILLVTVQFVWNLNIHIDSTKL